VERDLAALEDKVTTLGQEAERLCGIHADHADQIQAKRAEIVEYWESLTTKAKVCSPLYSLLMLDALICLT
jgi:spectrin alpha